MSRRRNVVGQTALCLALLSNIAFAIPWTVTGTTTTYNRTLEADTSGST